jgi:hypothetical protein
MGRAKRGQLYRLSTKERAHLLGRLVAPVQDLSTVLVQATPGLLELVSNLHGRNEETKNVEMAAPPRDLNVIPRSAPVARANTFLLTSVGTNCASGGGVTPAVRADSQACE